MDQKGFTELTTELAGDVSVERLRQIIDHLLGHIEIEDDAYDPSVGDGTLCECGHPYYRHFDTYEDMAAVGCKYCYCHDFKPSLITPAMVEDLPGYLAGNAAKLLAKQFRYCSEQPYDTSRFQNIATAVVKKIFKSPLIDLTYIECEPDLPQSELRWIDKQYDKPIDHHEYVNSIYWEIASDCLQKISHEGLFSSSEKEARYGIVSPEMGESLNFLVPKQSSDPMSLFVKIGEIDGKPIWCDWTRTSKGIHWRDTGKLNIAPFTFKEVTTGFIMGIHYQLKAWSH